MKDPSKQLVQVPSVIAEESEDDASSSSALHRRHLRLHGSLDHSATRFSPERMQRLVKIKRLSAGGGRFGKVYKYTDRRSMFSYTATRVKLDCLDPWNQDKNIIEQRLEELVKDVDLWTTIKHPRLTQVYGCFCSDTKMLIFREFLPRGSIGDRLKNEALTESQALQHLGEALEALTFLHGYKHPIIHRNIHANNLLLMICGEVKLTDYGISVEVAHEDFEVTANSSISHYRTSLLHMAPELLVNPSNHTNFTTATDIWALGCVFVNMLTQQPPFLQRFSDLTDNAVYRALLDTHRDSNSSFTYSSRVLTPSASERASSLLNSMLALDPEKRPSARDLLERVRQRSEKRTALVAPPLLSREHAVSEDDEEDLEEGHVKKRTNGQVDALDFNILSEQLNSGLEAEKRKEEEEEEASCGLCIRWHASRILIFCTLILKWMGLVLLAALSLACLAFGIFTAIYLIYNAISLVCRCHLNEGFIVLIAIILLPILILLTTLCCNNSCERYKQAVENGELEKSKWVYHHPREDIILCGVLVVSGSHAQKKSSTTRRKNGQVEDPSDKTSPVHLPQGSFARGVHNIA